jgi:hypothetical protein
MGNLMGLQISKITSINSLTPKSVPAGTKNSRSDDDVYVCT